MKHIFLGFHFHVRSFVQILNGIETLACPSNFTFWLVPSTVVPLFAVLLYQYLIMPNISQLHEGHIIVCNGKALPVDMKLGVSVEQGKQTQTDNQIMFMQIDIKTSKNEAIMGYSYSYKSPNVTTTESKKVIPIKIFLEPVVRVYKTKIIRKVSTLLLLDLRMMFGGVVH